MTTTLEPPARFDDPVDALRGIRAAREVQRRAQAHELECLVSFADLQRTLPDEAAALGYELVQWGGDGVPLINEHCRLELAAFLGVPVEEATLRLSEVQALKYRFPQLWRMVLSGKVKSWHAATITGLTSGLSKDLAAEMDARVASHYGFTPWRRLVAEVEAFVIEHDPAAAREQAEKARGARRVSFGEVGHPEVRGIEGVLDTADAVFLDTTIQRMADILREGGSTESRDVRRAKALGVLASPARALQLLQASLTEQLPTLALEDGLDAECPAQGQRGHTCGQVTVDPDRLLPRAQLVVHLTDETIGSSHGLARVENVGPVLAERVKSFLESTQVSVRPVLHPDRLVPTDAYECPPLMREHLMLRNPYDVFPHSHKPARVHGEARVDLDHTTPWTATATTPAEEPPTRPDNLGPLSRQAHRGKTFGGWQLEQVKPGVFWWRSPLGFEYLVTPSFTIPLTSPADARDEASQLEIPDEWPIPNPADLRQRAEAAAESEAAEADDRPPEEPPSPPDAAPELPFT